jgi:hypothetical protein
MVNQNRLPPRLIGCLTPRLVDGPAPTLSLSSESLVGEAGRFAFFATEGLAGGGGESDAIAGFWVSFDNSRLE